MHLTWEEVRDIAFDDSDEFTVVEQEEHGHGRWREYCSTVFHDKENRFWCINWERGLTDEIDNTFNDQDAVEMFPHVVLNVKKDVTYSTERQKKPSFMERGLSNIATFEWVSGRKLAVSTELVESAANTLALLETEAEKFSDLTADADAYIEATKNLLSLIKELPHE